MPLAPATGIGSTLDWADHSKSVWRFVSATISSPVIFFSSVAVVMGTSLGGRTRPRGVNDSKSAVGLLEVAQRRHAAGGRGLAHRAHDRVGHRLRRERADLAQPAVVHLAGE